MNEKRENQSVDQQLDELLRDVEMPASLKSDLQKIASSMPDQSIPKKFNGVEPDSKIWLRRLAFISVLAASLFAVAALIWFDWETGDPAGRTAGKTIKNEKDKSSTDIAKNRTTAVQNRLAQLSESRRALQAQIDSNEIAQLEDRLDTLNRQSSQRLDAEEVQSLVLVLVPEYSLPLGRESSEVKAEVTSIVERYPGTRGAKIAKQILERMNND